MNRDILFRGKRLNGDEWFEGDLSKVVHNDGSCYIFPAYGYNSPDWYEVDPETVCQYTGLTDKNGRKIFEGDIICNHYDDAYPEDETLAAVLWNGCKWGIKEKGSSDICDFELSDAENAEIVGNVFDNSKLLEDLK